LRLEITKDWVRVKDSYIVDGIGFWIVLNGSEFNGVKWDFGFNVFKMVV
jgi:hypothetical protein